MRIERIQLKNYRQYRDTEVLLSRGKRGDLHLIIGENGTGKSNLLNAVNWCLYGSEPSLQHESPAMPLLNVAVKAQTADGALADVEVAIDVTGDQGEQVRFVRTAHYRVYHSALTPVLQDISQRAYTRIKQGDTKPQPAADFGDVVEQFVPRNLKDYYFFDGDRLDNYFKKSENMDAIRNTVLKASQIDLIIHTQERLKKLASDIRRDVSAADPRTEEYRAWLEANEPHLQELEQEMEQIEQQSADAQQLADTLREQLSGLPDVDQLEVERTSLRASERDLSGLIEQFRQQRSDRLIHYTVALMLLGCVRKTLALIKQKKDQGSYPPTLDAGLLRSILDAGVCGTCGRPISDVDRAYVQDLLVRVKDSSTVGHSLMSAEPTLVAMREEAADFRTVMKSLRDEFSAAQRELDKVEERMRSVDQQMLGYDRDGIAEKHRRRVECEATVKTCERRLGQLDTDKSDLENQIKTYAGKLEDAQEDEGNVAELKGQLRLCTDADAALSRISERLMQETRGALEDGTKSRFFDLVWKTQAWRDVTIDDKYRLHLVHSQGYEGVGPGGGSLGEQNLLALAFTLALHEVSGYNAPLLIDTPVARISGQNRRKFAEVFAAIGQQKQTILLLSSSEYSEELAQVLAERAASIVNICMSPDENESTLKEVTL